MRRVSGSHAREPGNGRAQFIGSGRNGVEQARVQQALDGVFTGKPHQFAQAPDWPSA